MAFEVLDEHEQGELVRKWLRENAFSMLIGIALGIVLIFGWKRWEAHGVQRSAEAAAQFQALTDASDAKRDEDAGKIADALRKDYSGTAYATLAAMYQADIASRKNDLPGAASALEWASQHAGDDALKYLATLRLARVKLAQNDADGALKLANSVPADNYPGLAGELRGDALVTLGQTDAARTAYQDALTHLAQQGGANRSLVQMKLDELGAPAAKAEEPAKEKLGS